MVETSIQTERGLQLGARHAYRAALLALGFFAFRDLVGYDPFVHVHQGSSEFEDWFFRPSGSSASLIFGVAACFLYTRHRYLLRALDEPGEGGLGWLLIVPAAALQAWALYVGAPDLLLISLILMLLGASWWLGGRGALGAMLLPSLFLLLLVPVPAVLINQLIYPLQVAVASATAPILDLLGIESTTSGAYIFTPDQIFQVIESCAGLRIMDTLIMSAVIYAELFYRSRLQAVLLLLAAPLIAVVTNLLRVLSLVLNPYSSFAAIHTAQGIAMLVIGVLGLALVDRLLYRVLPPTAEADRRWVLPARKPTGDLLHLQRLLPLAAVLVAMAFASTLITPWKPPREIWLAPAKLPTSLDAGWESQALPLDKNVMGSVFPNRWTRRGYSKRRQHVEMFVASDDRSVRRTNLLSTKTALPEPGLRIVERERLTPGPDLPEVDSFLLERKERRILSYRWYRGVGGVGEEAFRGLLALDRSPLRRPGRSLVFRVSTPIDDTEIGRKQAERRLRDFMADMQPHFEELTRPLELF